MNTLALKRELTEKWYSCPHCDFASNQNGHLDQKFTDAKHHLAIHVTKSLWTCRGCGKKITFGKK